jgi:PLP dependent protein
LPEFDKYMHKIAHNLTQVQKRIQAAAQAAGRNPQAVTLLAVSKTQPAEALRAAHAAGQCHFGENYLQEALEKIQALQTLPLIWHFIGPLQSNKCKAVATHFDWLHSLDRLALAERLSRARPEHAEPLQVCVQVNIDGQLSKAGIAPQEAAAFCQALLRLPGLQLRGLMAIPDPANPLPAFANLAQLRDQLNQQLGLNLDTLSMGMSDDLEGAIAAGATLVRIGTAIFGARA